MPRPKKTAESVDISELAIVQAQQYEAQQVVKVIHPLTQEFGNGDLNILRDKINEIIKQ